jgi:DNA-binding NarL/FixJ family response regulator
MRITRHLARLLRAASAASDQYFLQQTTGAICVEAVQQASCRSQPIQPGIDYALWARQQQAWRLYAAPAREVQSSVQEVAQRKLAEAHSRYQQLQDTIAGASSDAGLARS